MFATNKSYANMCRICLNSWKKTWKEPSYKTNPVAEFCCIQKHIQSSTGAGVL